MKTTRRDCTTASGGLLHNMSCSARARIQHTSAYRRSSGRGVVFALPKDKDVLAELMGESGAGQLALTCQENARSELRRRINAHALTMALPLAAVVAQTAERGDKRSRSLLTIITVLAKSSDHVYLRDKEPNLGRIRPGSRVVLIVPEERSQ